MPGDNVPRGHADAGLQLESAQFTAQIAGGLQGHGGGIINVEGSAKNCEGCIALEFINNSFIAVYHLDDVLEELIELLHNFFGGVVNGKRGGTDDVNKKHRYFAVLSA